MMLHFQRSQSGQRHWRVEDEDLMGALSLQLIMAGLSGR
jgi:hypothetical protein